MTRNICSSRKNCYRYFDNIFPLGTNMCWQLWTLCYTMPVFRTFSILSMVVFTVYLCLLCCTHLLMICTKRWWSCLPVLIALGIIRERTWKQSHHLLWYPVNRQHLSWLQGHQIVVRLSLYEDFGKCSSHV